MSNRASHGRCRLGRIRRLYCLLDSICREVNALVGMLQANTALAAVVALVSKDRVALVSLVKLLTAGVGLSYLVYIK